MCFFYCCVVILLYFIYAPLWAFSLPLRTRSAVSGYLTSDVLSLADASSAWTSLDSASRTILHQRIVTDINGHNPQELLYIPQSPPKYPGSGVLLTTSVGTLDILYLGIYWPTYSSYLRTRSPSTHPSSWNPVPRPLPVSATRCVPAFVFL